MIARTLTTVSLSCLLAFGALHAGAGYRHDGALAIGQTYPEMVTEGRDYVGAHGPVYAQIDTNIAH